MSAPNSPIRFLRLQFSLRALLLLMLLVGGGITYYRWPWEEKIHTASGKPGKATYHRSWRGRPVKHGRSLIGRVEDYATEDWYDEGKLRFRRIWRGGVVESEVHYKHGVVHGPSWQKPAVGDWIQGQSYEGKEEGDWKWERGDLIHRQQYLAGVLHGQASWETKSGRLLQSARYEHGKIVEWNGLPILQALKKWSADHALPPALQQILLTRIAADGTVESVSSPHFIVEVRSGEQTFVVCLPEDFFWSEQGQFQGRLVGETLVTDALGRWMMLDFRFYMLHMVRLNAESVDWQDRTGVYDVKFPAGSPQERLWLGSLQLAEDRRYPVREQFERLLDSGNSPLIQVIVPSGMEFTDQPTGKFAVPLRSWFVRRDLFGHYLDRAGWYVEQAGNTLIARPQAKLIPD